MPFLLLSFAMVIDVHVGFNQQFGTYKFFAAFVHIETDKNICLAIWVINLITSIF